MTSQPPDQTQTAAITLSQLAAIAGRDASYFSLHKDELPDPVPIHGGAHGRPQHGYDLEQIAELVVDRVGHLSEAVVRLRLALSGHRPPVEKDRAAMLNLKNLGLFTLFEIDGVLEVVPRDHGQLTPELRAKVEASMCQEQTALQARRAKRQPRPNTHTAPGEFQ